MPTKQSDPLPEDSVRALMGRGYRVKQWIEEEGCMVEIEGNYVEHPYEVDEGISETLDLSGWCVILTLTDPVNKRRSNDLRRRIPGRERRVL